MAIAAIQNIPGTPEEVAMWAFVHQAHHIDIIRRIYELTQIALPQYILDPFDPQNPETMGTWSYLHQSMHDSMNGILGIEGNNLVDVDWTDQNELAGWIQLNYSDHIQAANILEVG